MPHNVAAPTAGLPPVDPRTPSFSLYCTGIWLASDPPLRGRIWRCTPPKRVFALIVLRHRCRSTAVSSALSSDMSQFTSGCPQHDSRLFVSTFCSVFPLLYYSLALHQPRQCEHPNLRVFVLYFRCCIDTLHRFGIPISLADKNALFANSMYFTASTASESDFCS